MVKLIFICNWSLVVHLHFYKWEKYLLTSFPHGSNHVKWIDWSGVLIAQHNNLLIVHKWGWYFIVGRLREDTVWLIYFRIIYGMCILIDILQRGKYLFVWFSYICEVIILLWFSMSYLDHSCVFQIVHGNNLSDFLCFDKLMFCILNLFFKCFLVLVIFSSICIVKISYFDDIF